MLAKRIIPCLDVKNGRVVKGVNFVGLRDAGDPVELARLYNEQGADELCFLDITATLDGRRAFCDVISSVAREVFIPLTVGGGVQTLDDIAMMLKHGADKVSLNSSAVKNPNLINQSVYRFGAQCTVVAVDIKANPMQPSGYEVYTAGGTHPTGLDALDWAKEINQRGAGEILLTSMEADGTRDGYDLEITHEIAAATNIPIIASGGAGSVEHIAEVLLGSHSADAALLASLLHMQVTDIPTIKTHLKQRNIPVRI